jgi:hypothetical protein
MRVSTERTFRSGDPVFVYWLAHSEGFALQAHGRSVGTVQDVALGAEGEAALLVVRSRGRERRVPADDVTAVLPWEQVVVASEEALPARGADARAALGNAGSIAAGGAARIGALVARTLAWTATVVVPALVAALVVGARVAARVAAAAGRRSGRELPRLAGAVGLAALGVAHVTAEAARGAAELALLVREAVRGAPGQQPVGRGTGAGPSSSP